MRTVVAWLIILVVAGTGGWVIGGVVHPLLLACVLSFAWGFTVYHVLRPALLED